MFGTARTQTNVIAQGPQVFVYMLNPKNNGKATSIQEIFSYPWQPPLPNNGQCPLYSLLQYPASQIFKHENTGKRRFKALNLPAGKGSVKVSVRLGCNLLQGVISSPGVSLRISFGTEFLLFAAVAKIRQASFQLRTCSEILSLTWILVLVSFQFFNTHIQVPLCIAQELCTCCSSYQSFVQWFSGHW